MKFVRMLILILIGVVVFGLTMTFANTIPIASMVAIRVGILLALGALWFTARGSLAAYRPIFFAYFTIALALIVSRTALTPITEWLHLGSTPMTNAAAKLIEAGLVTVTMIAVTLASGQNLGSLQLRKGKLAMGLGFGFLGFAAMVAVTFIPGGPFFKAGALDPAPLFAVLPWVLVFVLTNAFMEELVFRGALLERQEALVGRKLALFSTTLVFALAHVQVTYAAQLIFFVAFVFVLGLMWGYLMQKSNSIWGSVLFHAGADVAVILPMYQAMLTGN